MAGYSPAASLSDKYLEQIITQANKAGLLKSIRGRRRRLSVIPLGKGYFGRGNSAGNGRLFVSGRMCTGAGRRLHPMPKCGECATYELWRDIKTAVDQVIDNRSLQDMIDNYTRKNRDDASLGKEGNCRWSAK